MTHAVDVRYSRNMKTLPTSEHVRGLMQPLTRKQVAMLSILSDVSFNTLIKVQSGQTADPRLDTVAAFWPYLEKCKK